MLRCFENNFSCVGDYSHSNGEKKYLNLAMEIQVTILPGLDRHKIYSKISNWSDDSIRVSNIAKL